MSTGAERCRDAPVPALNVRAPAKNLQASLDRLFRRLRIVKRDPIEKEANYVAIKGTK